MLLSKLYCTFAFINTNMNLIDLFKNTFFYRDSYKTHSEAIIIACYFNPQCNPYRLKGFNTFYESIKHLNHQIIECVIGNAEPQLPITSNITRVYTKNLLWHKESLLNNIVKNLDPKYKYVFWVDADIIFMNQNWLVDSVNELRFKNILQPFEYCVHLDKDEEPSDFPIGHYRDKSSSPTFKHPRMWRSFCANYITNRLAANSLNYDTHGHVGFAWGARREVLELCPLYDHALVGGSDHIMAHAAAGHIPHSCIVKSFTDDIDAINAWSRKFFSVVGGSIGYVKGDLFHMWHGDLKSRQYLKRVQEFTGPSKNIVARDSNGLHVTDDDSYVRNYFREREVRDDVRDDLRTAMWVSSVVNNPSIDTILGDIINSANMSPNDIEFGGGDFGGAEGTWESSNDNIQNENFS